MHSPHTDPPPPLPAVRTAVFAPAGGGLGLATRPLAAVGPRVPAADAAALAAHLAVGLVHGRRRRTLPRAIAVASRPKAALIHHDPKDAMTRTPASISRACLCLATAAGAVLLGAGPAAAHVEVEADRAQALAENVTLTFNAESESDKAGITSLRVVLPKGIAPADVTYEDGPEGWTFGTSADGYTVKGPAVAVGADAEYSVRVRQLPDARELAFKTLQGYGDGRVDRWIELGASGDHGHGHGHGNSAPVLKLEAAAPGATVKSPAPTASPTPATSAAARPAPEASPASTPAAGAAVESGGLSAAGWTAIAAAAVAVVAALAFLLRRRSRAS
ncbi:DUF1775 domain-containing protein [Streptomyces sp. NPDC058992]|uniref:DUF1775 domain-containing protein n=1 Tax=Streptomyces sp. NPDC058992 TaxID=3346688 RepID=UPI00369B75E9